ncbi:MAG: RnfABCDGE type electron transport complex subunit D [Bacteroidota bacterium]
MGDVLATQNSKLEIARSPHVHSRWSTKQAMWLVIIALIPSVISSIVFFGFEQLLIIAVSVGFSIATEAAIKTIRKQQITIDDGSVIITGLLLALILPPNFSLVSTAIGAIIAVGIGKEVFGGLGFNIFNPALVGRAFLQAAFPVPMTTWEKANFSADSISSATPLSAMKFDNKFEGINNLFVGNIGGSIGETSAIAILIGGIFLLVMGVINYRVSLAMILSALIFGGIFWLSDSTLYPNPVFHLFAGGFLFGAIFMATDWVTSPLFGKGMWIYGILISMVVILIRLFGGLPEGVMYSILFMNAFVPLINKYTKPSIFGEVK